MRHFLISALLLGLVSGCSGFKMGPYRIDVQQGNALDQENVARLKPGLNRSQVRFLLGTPLVVDPFRSDRWDYVYLYYKAGKLTEQKRISLFFEGDTLARIEGDMPEATPVPATESADQPKPVDPGIAPAPAAPETSVVPPLPDAQNVPAYVDPRRVPEVSLQPSTDVSAIQPDFALSATEAEAPVLNSVNEWAAAWSRRDKTAYFSAYVAGFVPEGRFSHAEWEKRKRHAIDAAKSIEVRIDSPHIRQSEEGTVSVDFNQFYRSDRFSDGVAKQLQMVEQAGRWLIVEEKVVSVLHGAQA